MSVIRLLVLFNLAGLASGLDRCNSKDDARGWEDDMEALVSMLQVGHQILPRYAELDSISTAQGIGNSGQQELPAVKFLHIPKTGGSAIEKAGRDAGYYWGVQANPFVQNAPWPYEHDVWRKLCGTGDAVSCLCSHPQGCLWYHVPPAWLAGTNDPIAAYWEGGQTFCSVRDPYARAVSHYTWALTWQESPPFTGDCTPELMNAHMQSIYNDYLEGKTCNERCHTVPQNEFIWGPDGHQWCQHIIHQENLNDEFKILMQEFALDVELSETRVSQTSFDADLCPNLSINDLTNETVALLDLVYTDDFRLLGYAKRT